MPELGRKANKSWVLALASVASCMVALDALVVTTALSAIRLDLGASLEALEWIVNAYNLSFAVLLLTGAALGDRFGRRRMFACRNRAVRRCVGACALAGSVGWLIAARAIQGAGAALVMPLAMALLSAAFPREERGKALGIFSGVTGVALIAGPVVGGAIAQGLAWQWIFWLNLPIGVVVIPLAMRRIAESFGPGTALDIAGPRAGDGRGARVGVGPYAREQRRLEQPRGYRRARRRPVARRRLHRLGAARPRADGADAVLPRRAHSHRASRRASSSTPRCMASCSSCRSFCRPRRDTGLSARGCGCCPGPRRCLWWRPSPGHWSIGSGERPLVVAGLILQALGMAWIALIATPDVAYLQLVAPLILAGAGVSMAMPAAQNAVLSSVAGSEVGKASGTFNMLRYLGGAFGIAVLAAVFAHTGSLASAQAFSRGFALAIGVAAGLSLAAAVAGLGLPARRTPGACQCRGRKVSSASIAMKAVREAEVTCGVRAAIHASWAYKPCSYTA